MSYVADRFVVVLDANILHSFRKRDILLSFHQAGLFRARWTKEILNEWRRHVVERKPELEKCADAQLAAMQEHFGGSIIENYETLISCISLPDENDRHVLAAAIRCGAQHVVTENLKAFPPKFTDAFDIEAISADEFLSRTFDLYRTEATIALKQVRERLKSTTYSPSEFVMDLTAKGMPKLATRARDVRNII